MANEANLQPVPFEKGNELALTHGAYARLRLSEAAGDTADVIRDLVPIGHDADEPTVQAFAFVLEQLRAAGTALDASANGKRTQLLRLSQDARGWANVALRYARELGLTPRSRGELGLDLARTRRAATSDYDLTRLNADELRQFQKLLAKAEAK